MSMKPVGQPKYSVPGLKAAVSHSDSKRHTFFRSDVDDAAETQLLKAALKRAVAKTEAPAYLIEAIRRRISE